MSVADNFDYSIPSLNRKDLMSLSTVNQNDIKIRPFKKMDTQRDWSINLYNLDIEQSTPKRFGIFTNKVDFINKVDDIDRTNPKLLHYGLNKPEYNLTNVDIPGTITNNGHLKTKRNINPLEPKYILPKFEEYPPEEPKFIRDAIDIKDIRGARPQKYFQWKTRETFPLDNNGIEGSKPKKKYVRKTKYNNIDYSDLTRDIFKTRRHISPLDPIYDLKYKNGEHYQYGMIEKSKPQTFYPYKYADPFILKTEDIEGTRTGSKNRINKFTGLNFEMVVDDIKGTKVGSLKKGITTKRNTNPLIPVYQMPGAVELKQPNNDPFGKTMYQKKLNIKTPEKIERKASSAKQMIREEEHKANTQNEGNFENEENFKPYLYKEDNVEFNKVNYNRPDPFYGFIHDQYVSPSENPNIREEIKQKKAESLMAKTTGGFYNISKGASKGDQLFGGITNIQGQTQGQNSTQLGEGMQTNTMMNKTIKNSNQQSMYKTTTNFPKMTYAQKLDKFMETNKLNYVGEAI